MIMILIAGLGSCIVRVAVGGGQRLRGGHDFNDPDSGVACSIFALPPLQQVLIRNGQRDVPLRAQALPSDVPVLPL